MRRLIYGNKLAMFVVVVVDVDVIQELQPFGTIE